LPKDFTYAIVNLDRAGKEGSHWYALHRSGDSYDPLLPNGMEFDIEQNDHESDCGIRALAWCLLHSRRPDLANLV